MSVGSPYGPRADPGPPGLAPKLVAFCEELRSEGVAVGTSEILDAFAALEHVEWTSQDDFREALATTIAKSQDDRRVFELLFERYFFRAAEAEAVDYGAVRNVLAALDSRPAHARPVRIALMTAIGVTKHTTGHDWKRRGERLVRASGRPYTIVRPGWFDYNEPDQLRIEMLQGDRRWASDPSDGVVSRAQIAQVLVASLTSAAANRKTLELVAEQGSPPVDLEALFAALTPDPVDALDGVLDRDNMPLAEEPEAVRAELDRVKAAGSPGLD